MRAAFADGVATKANLRAETIRLEAKVESLDAKIGVMQWALGFIALLLLTLAMAARLYRRPKESARVYWLFA